MADEKQIDPDNPPSEWLRRQMAENQELEERYHAEEEQQGKRQRGMWDEIKYSNEPHIALLWEILSEIREIKTIVLANAATKREDDPKP